MVRPRRMPPTEAARRRRRRRCGEALQAARLQLAVRRDALARGSPAGSPVRAERLWLPHSPDRPNTADTHQPVRRSSYLAVQQALARHTAQAALMLAARSCPGRGAGAAVPGRPARPGLRGERCAGRRGTAPHRRAASRPKVGVFLRREHAERGRKTRTECPQAQPKHSATSYRRYRSRKRFPMLAKTCTPVCTQAPRSRWPRTVRTRPTA